MATLSGSKFQIHLSTLVVLSVELGALLLLSFPVNSRRIWSPDPRMRDDTVVRREWGWPYKLVQIDSPAGPPQSGEYVGGYFSKTPEVGIVAFMVNGVVCFLILAFTITLLEHKARREKPVIQQSWVRKHILTLVIAVSLITVYFSSRRMGDLSKNLSNYQFVLGVAVGVVFEICQWKGITGPKLF